MADFDPLDPSVACHPILPANVPIDQIRYSTILPVEVNVGGVTNPAEIPAGWLMPSLFANVNASSDKHLKSLKSAASASGTVVPSWKKVDLRTEIRAPSFRVTSLGELLVSRKVVVNGKEVPIELDEAAIDALSQGQPVVVKLERPDGADTVEVELKPDFDLPGGHYVVSLDAAGRANLLRSGEVAVARVGRKSVVIDPAQIDALVRNGQALLRFADYPEATLTILTQENTVATARRQFVRDLPPGETADATEDMPVNLADMFSGSMVALTSSGGETSPIRGPRASAPPGSGWSSVPAPPDISLPRFPLVLYVPYLQDWTLHGYARGALLNTISMGPLEETTIEVFSWERRRRESESTTGSETESLLEGTVNNKDTLDVVDETRRENGWKLDAGVNVSYPGVPISGKVGFELKDQLTQNTKNATQNINEATAKASNKIKATRQTKVIETSEFGTESKVVRRLRNPNTGRTLNLDCFEVLAHYGVRTSLETTGIRLAVLAEMYDFLAPMLANGPGQKEAVLLFEHVIAPLIPVGLQAGFAATRFLLASERLCAFKCAAACKCEEQTTSGSESDAPQSREGELVALIPGLAALCRDAINLIASAGFVTLGSTIKQHWDNILNSDASSRPNQDQWDAARLECKRYLFRRFVMDGPATRFWSAARTFARAQGLDEAVPKRLIAARKIQGIDVLNTISTFVTMQYRVVGEIGTMIGGGWPLVVPDMITSGLGFDDAGLEPALDALQSTLTELAELRKPPAPPPAAAGGENALPGLVAAVAEPPEFGPRELAEASIDFDLLIRYLQNNMNFFRAQLWKSIDPADRLRFLSAYGSLGSLTSGRILGFVGTSAILEIDTTKNAELAKWFNGLTTTNADLADAFSTFKTILPTPGVTLEARLGACDALEPYLVESRAIELERTRYLADQQKLEVERRQKRLDGGDYGDPSERPPLVVLERPPA